MPYVPRIQATWATATWEKEHIVSGVSSLPISINQRVVAVSPHTPQPDALGLDSDEKHTPDHCRFERDPVLPHHRVNPTGLPAGATPPERRASRWQTAAPHLATVTRTMR